MGRDRFIVDIRRHRGDSNFIIGLVARYCSGFPDTTVEWLVRGDQAPLLQPDSILGQGDQFDGGWALRVSELLVRQAQNVAAGGTFWVLSYDNVFLSQAGRMTLPNVTVRTMHLGELFKMGILRQSAVPPGYTTPRQAFFGAPSLRPPGPLYATLAPMGIRPPGAPATSAPLTLTEAIDLAKRVLLTGGHTSRELALPQKELRPRMAYVDGRATKIPGDPASEALISSLVDQGLQEGWLKRFRYVPEKTGTEAVYLVVPEAERLAPLTPAFVLPAPKEHISTAPEAKSELSVPASPEPLQAHEPPMAVQPEEGELSVKGPSGQISAAVRKKHPNRATEFERQLSHARIGSMTETRGLFFDALESIVADAKDQPLLLPDLFSKAEAGARQQADAAGYAAEKNWRIAQRCIQRLMLWAGVLISDKEQVVSDTIGSNCRRIARLKDDFRRICEAYMAEYIISHLGRISYDDDPYYLGLTLYRRGGQNPVPAEDLKSKADELLSFLLEQGRIEMDGDRQICVKGT